MQKNLAIRRLTLLKKINIPVAGTNGTARLVTYAFRGAETTAAQVFFVRDIQAPDLNISKTRICYVLSVETAADPAAN